MYVLVLRYAHLRTARTTPRVAAASLAVALAIVGLGTPQAMTVIAPAYTGVSLRQSSQTFVSNSADALADHPDLRLVSPMAPWSALEPQDDVFDFSQLDADVQHARVNGYRLLVRVMAGRNSPAWLPGVGVDTIRVLGTDKNASDYCDWIDPPVPWDPELAIEYRELMQAFGAWAASPDGAGGINADHLYVVPVAMPTIQGSEMQIGNGVSATCPAGTDGSGLSLTSVNAAAWGAISTVAERRTWIADAWRDAISIHMEVLPPDVRSIIAWGSIFGDKHEAALDIARTMIGPYRDRLWSMFTNLQPLSPENVVSGVWKDWCPACHEVVMAALTNGGTVGFQVARTDQMDTAAEFHAAVDDALDRYAPRFIEGSASAIASEEEYLLTGPDPVQDRLAAMAGQVLASMSVGCSQVALGDPSTCTALVTELWDDPHLVPAGDVTWSSGGEPAQTICTLDVNGMCSVQIVPSQTGASTVVATYAGDAAHRPVAAEGTIQTLRRPVDMDMVCTSTVVAGHPASCQVSVADAGQVTPTGSIAWSAAGAGSLSSETCSLQGSEGVGSCSISYAPATTGTSYVTASYEGSAVHEPAATSVAVEATIRSSAVTVACPIQTVAVGSTVSCTATVSDASGPGAVAPTGTVGWSSESVGGFGSVTTCSLQGTGSTRSCSVDYVPWAEGGHVLVASYTGDGLHEGSAGSGAMVAAIPDTTPPSVSITSPANNASVPRGKTVTITATASDASGVTRVEFRVGSTLLCTDPTTPYSCAWLVPKKASVTYTLTATAFDVAGNARSVSIIVRAR